MNMCLTQVVNMTLNLASDKYEMNPRPDDQAFLNCVNFMDFRIVKRAANRIVLSVLGEEMEVKLIDTMPFDAFRKKMSVVVKQRGARYTIYTKGADSAIIPNLKCTDKEKKLI
jgi:magnesium-transporting ATPase (P-type)